MPDRFYADSEFKTPTVELSPSESHHLAHVLRSAVGDQVALFNGRGGEAVAEIERISRKIVCVRLQETSVVPPLSPAITLATAIPKGERFRWLVEKTAELGVTRLIPLETARSVVKPGSSKLDKMRQTAIAAAKQSGAPHLLQIEEAVKWADFVASWEDCDSVYVAHPGGERLASSSQKTNGEQALILAIGPEGGFTEDEAAEAAARGARIVSLGPNLLRIETAAIAIAAYWRLYGAGASDSTPRPG